MSFDNESFALGVRNSGLSTGALTVSKNGVYLAPEGEAYNKVTVSVNAENGGAEILVPEGYTQMEYLESTGAQYIKTGHYVTNDTAFEVLFRHIVTGDQYIFGVNTENENEGCYIDIAGSLYFKFGVGNYKSFQIMHNYVSKRNSLTKKDWRFKIQIHRLKARAKYIFSGETMSATARSVFQKSD